MVELDLVVAQETREERRIRKPQSLFQISCENNNFSHIFIQMILTQGRTPLDNRSGNQKNHPKLRFQGQIGSTY